MRKASPVSSLLVLVLALGGVAAWGIDETSVGRAEGAVTAVAQPAYAELSAPDFTSVDENFEGVIWGTTGNGRTSVQDVCYAYKNCTGGCQISCEGQTTCSIGVDHVDCDGSKTYCNTCCTYGACTSEADCDPPYGVCTPDIGRCMSSGCCICA